MTIAALPLIQILFGTLEMNLLCNNQINIIAKRSSKFQYQLSWY